MHLTQLKRKSWNINISCSKVRISPLSFPKLVIEGLEPSHHTIQAEVIGQRTLSQGFCPIVAKLLDSQRNLELWSCSQSLRTEKDPRSIQRAPITVQLWELESGGKWFSPRCTLICERIKTRIQFYNPRQVRTLFGFCSKVSVCNSKAEGW